MSTYKVMLGMKTLSKHNLNNDDFVILIMAINPHKPDNPNLYPYFDNNIVNSIDSLKHANVTSGQGKKHNKSYGKYFGFEIINKFRIQDGLSFGTFQGKKINNIHLEEDICSKPHSQFMIILNCLNKVILGIIQAGNNQMLKLCVRSKSEEWKI